MNALRRKVRGGLRRLGVRRPAPHAIGRVVFAFAKGRPDAFFVQVGSNDGKRYGDPLFDEIEHRDWRGIMIEPVPYIFERLRENHGDNPRLALENVAIADHDGSQEFFYLREATPGEEVPAWYAGLGSFRKDVVLSHGDAIPDIDRRLAAVDVPCLTFDSLCARHGVDHIDLVHIDTEGYDFEIIKLIDFDRVAPTIVIFENHHMDPATRAACLAHLEARGYEHISNPMDSLCLRVNDLTGRDLRVRWLWRWLRARPTPDLRAVEETAAVRPG